MASEILGLFGGQTPQQLRNAYLDSMMISPAQMGSQSLLQQVVSMGQNAGAMLGAGAGQLLGGKVAGEVESSYIEEAVKEASKMKDAPPSKKMKAVADALADKPGMGRQYLMAMKEANKLEAEELALQEARVKGDVRDEYIERPKYDPLTGKQIGTESIRITKYRQPDGTYSTKPYKPLPQASYSNEGRNYPTPQGATTSPVVDNKPRGTIELPPQTAAEIAKAREDQRIIQEARDIMYPNEKPQGGGLVGAEPEGMPPADEKPMKFGNEKLRRAREALRRQREEYVRRGLDTTTIDRFLLELKKKIGD